MMFEVEGGTPPNARIKIVGVGGGAGNAVRRMIDAGVDGVEFIYVDTDAQALSRCVGAVPVYIGKSLTGGLGTGARPAIGREAANQSRDDVARVLANADLVILIGTMGGGTGTGAAAIVAELARGLGALVTAIVSEPFAFEGTKRRTQAAWGIAELRQHAHTTFVLPSASLLPDTADASDFASASRAADEVLLEATRGIVSLISVTGLVDVNFADVRSVLQNGGSGRIGVGRVGGIDDGENRAVIAARQAVTSPLLGGVGLHGATGAIVNISGGADLTLGEVHQINETVHDAVGDGTEIVFGAVHEPAMQGRVHVVVLAMGPTLAPEHVPPEPAVLFDLRDTHVQAPVPPAIVVAWDPEYVDSATYAEVIALLGDLARAEGAAGVSRIRNENAEIPALEGSFV